MSDANTSPAVDPNLTRENFEVESNWFSLEQLEGATAGLVQLVRNCQHLGVEVIANYTPDDRELKENETYFVFPLLRRADKTGEKMTVEAVVIAIVPDYTAFLGAPSADGKISLFVKNRCIAPTVRQTIIAQIKTCRKRGTSFASLPRSLESFVEVQRAASQYKSFRAVEKNVRDALKEKAKNRPEMVAVIDSLTPVVFRSCLSSASFCRSMLGDVFNSQAGIIINLCKKMAAAKNLDVEIFDYWLANRDETSLSLDMDFSDLDDIVPDDDAGREAAD